MCRVGRCKYSAFFRTSAGTEPALALLSASSISLTVWTAASACNAAAFSSRTWHTTKHRHSEGSGSYVLGKLEGMVSDPLSFIPHMLLTTAAISVTVTVFPPPYSLSVSFDPEHGTLVLCAVCTSAAGLGCSLLGKHARGILALLCWAYGPRLSHACVPAMFVTPRA